MCLLYSNGVRSTEYAQSNTAFEEAFQWWGMGGRGVICCCFFRSFLRLPITWWVSHVSILPVVSTPWKSSLKYKADFSLAIWAPKDKIDSNELIVLAILSVFILSLSGSTNSAKDQQDSFWDQQSVRYCYWLT